jgi:hypothetical protein
MLSFIMLSCIMLSVIMLSVIMLSVIAPYSHKQSLKCRDKERKFNTNRLQLGAKGASSPATFEELSSAVLKEDYLGIMVWYASVKNGLQVSVAIKLFTRCQFREKKLPVLKFFF